ncbi:MAG: DUF4172 domain-containing protein [Proteobacteria bacterium]|nr:DUF4172 domain-containing protein [Pseudomonadota bacterium]
MKRTFIFFGIFISLSDVLWAFDKDDYIKPEAAETLYFWQSPCWPNFQYDLSEVQTTLEAYDRETAALSQRFYNLSPSLQREVMRKIIVLDAIKILKLDNEIDLNELFSLLEHDIKDNDLKKSRDLGLARLIFLISQTFKEPLSQEQLFKYHETVIMDPLQRDQIKVGRWRTQQIYVKDWEQDQMVETD